MTFTCYSCPGPKSSDEHVPPKCLFPEIAEFGLDTRRNLITVPSCDAHNSQKSGDDEFFRTVLLMRQGLNGPGRHQFEGKLLRAAGRRPNTYGKFFADKGLSPHGEARILAIDRDRFDRCIRQIAKGLFYFHSGERWDYPILTMSSAFLSSSPEGTPMAHVPSEQMAEVTHDFLKVEPIRGENPEVFKYRIRFDEAPKVYSLACLFYEIFEVCCYSSIEFLEQTV